MIDELTGEDLTAPQVIADPYAYFGRLRATDPVHWNPVAETWIVTRYSDVIWLIRNADRFSSAVFAKDHRDTYPPIDAADRDRDRVRRKFWSGAFINVDRPAHLEMRKSVHRWFTPQAVEMWRPRIRATIRDLIDRRRADGHMEVKADLATPLPLLTICLMLGVPASDAPYLRDLALRFVGSGFGPDRMGSLVAGIEELERYFTPLIEARAKDPQYDLVSMLAEGERAGSFTRSQVLATVSQLMIAGHETTHNLVANAVLALVRHPEQWDRLRADPESLVARATEECLRFDSPVKGMSRISTESVELGGKQIRANDRVFWVISAANRDPEAFSAPDSFDVARFPNQHVAFGGGIHHCLGAALARLEGQEALRALAEAFPSLHLLSESVEYFPNLVDRSVRSLHVGWSES